MNDFIQSSSGHLNGLKLAEKTQSVTKSSSNLAANSNFTSVPSSAQEFVDNKNGLQKKKKSAKLMPTIRFELNLEPPTSEKFSEFNYNKLVVKTIKLVKQKSKSAKSTSVNETSNDSQKITKSDLSILAGEFLLERCRISSLLSHYRKKVILSREEETNENNLLNTDLACETNDGFNENDKADDLNNDDNSMDSESSNNNAPMKSSSRKSKKKSNRYDSENNQYKLKDFNYLGQGYDEDDSFIDNSEAIDERVPADMAPKKGGFYINKGNLKMEKIEEQRAKAKLAKKQARQQMKSSASVKKEKIKNESNGDESSTDEDFNPDEVDEERGGGNDADMSGSDENDDDSDTDTDSDSDSDEDSYDSDEDSEEIDEVSGNEDQNLDEIKLRNKKLIKTGTDSSHTNKNNNNKNESDYEVIEISSNSNSNQSSKRNLKANKRRIADDDDDEDVADDDTAGKENIENSNKQIAAGGSDNNKKRKRVKESSGASNDSYNLVNTEAESDNNLPGPSKQQQQQVQQQPQKVNIQEPGEVVRNSIQQPVNLTPRMKTLIESFLTAFSVSNSLNSAGGNVWTEELKTMLFKIYQESLSQPQTDRSNIITYISNKTGKTREVLMRHCRNQSNKMQSSGSGGSQAQQQQQPQPQIVNRLPTDLKTAYYQKLNETVSPKVPNQSPKPLTLNDLSDDLRIKLANLEKLFSTFKQTKEPINKFFELQKASHLIYSIDSQTKVTAQTKACRQTRDLVLDIMRKTFEITREVLLEAILRIRTQHQSNLLQNKLVILKQFIDEEMVKQLNKYRQAFDEYLKNKAAYEAAVQANSETEKKKITPPRKKFEWTVKIRDIYLQIVNLKMSMYRSSSKPPFQSPIKQPDSGEETAKRNEYLRTFLTTTILPMWIDNWMQLNVLLHMSSSKPGNRSNQQDQSRVQPPPQSSPSTNKTSVNSPNVNNKPFVTNGSIINLASKSGKKITLEHQPLGKPQQAPTYQSTTMTIPQPAKSTSRPTTPSQQHQQQTPNLNRSLQLNNDNKMINKSKISPPITNLTNTRPPGMGSSSMQHQVSPIGTTKKPNNLSKSNPQGSSNTKLSPNAALLQQQQLQYLQQHFDLNIFNTTGNLVSPSGNGNNNGQLASMAYHSNLTASAQGNNYKNPSNN